MKKMFKKLKLKYLARSLLVVIVLVYGTLICSAAAPSTTVTLSNPNNVPMELNSIPYFLSDSPLDEPSGYFQFGETISVNLQPVPFPFISVSDGMLNFIDDVTLFGIPVNVPDGLYTGFLFLNYSDISSLSIGLVVPDGKDYFSQVVLDGFATYSFVFYDDIPTNIDLIVVDAESLTPIYLTFFLVPYVPVIDDVGSVWTDLLDWFISCINVVVVIFWTGTQLTLIGTLALVGTVISLCLLIFNKFKDFLRLK